MNSSCNSIPLRAYLPFRILSLFWPVSSSIAPSSPTTEEAVEVLGLNIISKTASFDDELQTLNLPERIKPITPTTESSPHSLFLPITSSSSNSPCSIINSSPDSSCPSQEVTPLKRSVSFNQVVEAFLITPRDELHQKEHPSTYNPYEPSPKAVHRYIEKEWDKGNLYFNEVMAREALIQKKKEKQMKSRIVQLKLSDA